MIEIFRVFAVNLYNFNLQLLFFEKKSIHLEILSLCQEFFSKNKTNNVKKIDSVFVFVK